MTRLLGELIATGTRVAATSNTPPNALGEGRFAASDFLREIQALSVELRDAAHRRHSTTATATLDGHAAVARATREYEQTIADAAATRRASRTTHSTSSSRTSRPCTRRGTSSSIDGLDAHRAARRARAARPDRRAALRRLHRPRLRRPGADRRDRASRSTEVFADEMLAGGYRKKYLRAISRLIALPRSSCRRTTEPRRPLGRDSGSGSRHPET